MESRSQSVVRFSTPLGGNEQKTLDSLMEILFPKARMSWESSLTASVQLANEDAKRLARVWNSLPYDNNAEALEQGGANGAGAAGKSLYQVELERFKERRKQEFEVAKQRLKEFEPVYVSPRKIPTQVYVMPKELDLDAAQKVYDTLCELALEHGIPSKRLQVKEGLLYVRATDVASEELLTSYHATDMGGNAPLNVLKL
jgi:hypothetical protein